MIELDYRGGPVFTEDGQKKVDMILSRYPKKLNALLPLLHLAQEENEGYLTPAWLSHIANICETSPTHVEGVATFYTMFKFRRPGKYHLQVCTNISCSLNGGEQLLHQLEKRLNIHSGDTTEDGIFSLEECECLGACGGAPVVIVNQDYHEGVSPQILDEMIDEMQGNKA